MTANTRKGTPGKTLAGFVAILGVVAVFSVRDWGLRSASEEWFYPSALGDGDLFEGFAGVRPGSVVAEFGGRPLVAPEGSLVALEDAAVEKAGREDRDRFFLYRLPGGGEEATGGLFIKVESGAGAESRYLRVRWEEGES